MCSPFGYEARMERRAVEILTVRETAAYLNLHPQTVYKMARAGHLPSVKIGRSVRFLRELLNEWLEAQLIEVK